MPWVQAQDGEDDVKQSFQQSVQRLFQRTGVGGHDADVVDEDGLQVQLLFGSRQIIELGHVVVAQTRCPLNQLTLIARDTKIDLVIQCKFFWPGQ